MNLFEISKKYFFTVYFNMRILNIKPNYMNISHRGYYRTVYKPNTEPVDENVLHRNTTELLRADYHLRSIITFFAKKFKDVDKVAFFDYASSIGLEAYSFLLGMDSFLTKEDANKFLPIFARDYDEEVIKEAQSRNVDISKLEESAFRIYDYKDDMFLHYKENFYPISGDDISTNYRVSDKYSSRVQFEVGDITKDYINLPRENVILSIRNCWPYFSKEDQLLLPEKLCNHFEKNAVIMIGSFDFNTQHIKDFLKNGFKRAYVKTNGAVFYK